jgi:hypothetical protein
MDAEAGRHESIPLPNPIGGYFELELNQGTEYHTHAIRLNTGRNAFEYILRARHYRKVYLPYYTCDAMLEPVQKLGLECQFYHIDANLEPRFDPSAVQEGEGFVYTNYFGLKDGCVELLARTCPNLIVDNAQAFFSRPVASADVFLLSTQVLRPARWCIPLYGPLSARAVGAG